MKYVILLLLILVAQAGGTCNGSLITQTSPVECDDLLETSTRRSLSVQESNLEQLVQTIAAEYQITPDQIAVYDDPVKSSAYTRTNILWDGSVRSYRLDTVNQQLQYFWIEYRDQEPNVDDILTCLGPPESYLSWYGLGTADSGTWLRFMLFYPQKGVITSTSIQKRFADTSKLIAPIPISTSRLPVNGIRFSPSNTTTVELLQDYLNVDLMMDLKQQPGQTILAWYTQLLRPWPGDIHQLEYSTLAYPEIPLVPNQSSP